MKLTYKKLNSIFINMAQSMKSNGECSLGANSLLDRFAKSASFNSRQELKSTLNKAYDKEIYDVGGILIESYKQALASPYDALDVVYNDIASYMSNEYASLLYRDDYKESIITHGVNGIDKYSTMIFESNVDSFLLDQSGLFFHELKLAKTERLADRSIIAYKYLNQYRSDKPFRIHDLKSIQFRGTDELMWEIMIMDITDRMEDHLDSINAIASEALSNHLNDTRSSLELVTSSIHKSILHYIKGNYKSKE